MSWRNLCAVGAVGLMATALIARTALAGDEHDHAHAEIGKKAPDFTLPSVDGKQVKLADFAGKVVVLEWTNHECPVVNRYVAKQKTMQKTFDGFKGKDVVWFAIDSSHFAAEKKDGITKYIGDNKITYPYLLDPEGTVGHQYGAKTTPHMYVIDKKGNLAYAGSLDDDEKGGKENARNYVAEAVNALLTDSAVATSKTQSFGCSVKYKK